MADHLVTAFGRHVEDCSALPKHLPSFLNIVLESSYPPKGSNKIVSIWLLRSIQSALGKFRPVLAIEFLEIVREGLCLWMSDDCATFADDEYSNEIVPLFQTILVQLEALSPSTAAITTLSPIIESVIRMDGNVVPLERKEALVAFEDFWTNCCKHLRPPSGDWSEGLSRVFGCFSSSSFLLVDGAADAGVRCQSNVIELDSDDDELDTLPRTTTPRRRFADLVPLPPSPPERVRIDASITRTAPPVRSSKVPTLAPPLPALFGTLPPSPTQHKSRQRRSSSHRSHRRASSSSKSHLSDVDKENAPPVPNLSSDDVVLSSKRALLDADSTPIRAKRRRTESDETVSSDDSIADAHAVEQLLCSETEAPSLASPFGLSKVNMNHQVSTPTKRALRAPDISFARQQTRTPFSSPTKRRKTQSGPLSASNKQFGAKAGCNDDDDYLPPSDIESEDEDQTSSSSPIGPVTPKQTRKAAFLTREPDSDDLVALDSSPTRSIKRVSRLSSDGPLAALSLSPVF